MTIARTIKARANISCIVKLRTIEEALAAERLEAASSLFTYQNAGKNLPAAITPSARNCLGTNTPHINAEPSPNALTNIFTVLLFFTNELKKKVIARHIRAYTTVLAKRKAPAAVNIAPLYKIHDVMKYKAIIPNATRKHPLAI